MHKLSSKFGKPLSETWEIYTSFYYKDEANGEVEVFSENSETKSGDFTISPPYLLTFDGNGEEIFRDANNKPIRYRGSIKVYATNIQTGKEFTMSVPYTLIAVSPQAFDDHLNNLLNG